MEIEKITKWQNKFWHGLSQKQAYQLEKDILLLLEKNFKCICGQDTYHFPKIVSCVDTEYKFKLTNCGTSLNKTHKNKKIPNQSRQVDCIIENMKKSSVQQLDMTLDGKNVCLDADGTLSIIDFDIASINEYFLSTKLQDKFEMYTNQKPKEWFDKTGNSKIAHMYTNKEVVDYYSFFNERLQEVLYNFKN